MPDNIALLRIGFEGIIFPEKGAHQSSSDKIHTVGKHYTFSVRFCDDISRDLSLQSCFIQQEVDSKH